MALNYRMSRIRSKDTKIEIILRRALWKKGIRYRKNCTEIMGKPDIAFPSKKIAIFCDSEFWHGYNWGNNKKHNFKNRKQYWINKIERNIYRDKEVNKYLRGSGWTVLRFWEKEIYNNIDRCVITIENALRGA